MPFCTKCGSETKDEQKFCKECGQPLTKRMEKKSPLSASSYSFENLHERIMGPTKARRLLPKIIEKGILCILAVAVGLFLIYIGNILFNDSPFQGKWYDSNGRVVLDFISKTEMRTGEGGDEVTVTYKQLENNHFMVHTFSGEMEFWIEEDWGDTLLNCTLYEAFDMGPVRIYRRGKIPAQYIGEEEYTGLFTESVPHVSEPLQESAVDTAKIQENTSKEAMPVPLVTDNIPLEQLSPAPESDFEYKLIPNNQIEILSYLGQDRRVKIPEQIDGKTVTRVSGGSESLEELYIPDGVKEIGDYSFRGSKIRRVRCPGSLQVIGENAFSSSPLEEITLPDSLTIIEENAFYECGQLQSVVLGTGLKEIGDRAFRGTAIKTIDLPDNLEKIGNSAFEFCTFMEDITIPNSVKYLSNDIIGGLFSGCKSLKFVKLPDKLTELPANVFSECSSLETLNLPQPIEVIGNSSFKKCESLSKIILPNGVQSIKSSAFEGCKNLETIYIPEATNYIDSWAFRQCNILTIYAPEGSYAQTFAEENEINFIPAASPEEIVET